MSKETQKEQLLRMFRENGNILSLGEIMETNLGSEYRARFSELRNDGYQIICTINKKEPSKNLYTLYNPSESLTKLTEEEVVKSTLEDRKTVLYTDKGCRSKGIVQVESPCPKCGSYYRRNGICNVCE